MSPRRLLCALSVLAFAGDASSQSTDLARVVANVEAVYARANTFEARLTERSVTPTSNMTLFEMGRIVFEKPSSFDVRYDSGFRSVNVSDRGCRFTPRSGSINDYAEMGRSNDGSAVFGFLVGLSRAYTIQSMRVDHGDYVLKVWPRAVARFDHAELFVSAASWHVHRIDLFQTNGNREQFDLDHDVLNTPAVHVFSITLPRGTLTTGRVAAPRTCP